MKSRSFFVICALVLLAYSRLSAQILPETTTDYLNIYKVSGHVAAYQACIQAGAKVINFPADTSFATVWVPPNYAAQAVKRVMVTIHGTKGSAYAAMNDEFANALANNYAVVGIQWWLQGATASADGSYLDEATIYHLIDTTLKHVKAKYSADLSRVGYTGFSRGSAASYVIMFYDRYRKTNYFALSISCSGGIPPPPGTPKPPLGEILQKRYGGIPLVGMPFSGTSFFYYCGLKDEEWGTTMCDQISYADSLMKANGAQTVRRISDPNGLHAGYRTNTGYQASAAQWFLDLTSTPKPPALTQPADKAVSQPLATTVQWATTASAAIYDVQVSANSGFTTTLVRDSLISANATSKQLSGLAAGTSYYWRVRSKNNVGASEWSETRNFTTQGMTGVTDNHAETELLVVAPNPLTDQTAVRFSLTKREHAMLKLYNTLGQEVASLLDAELEAGEHSWSFVIRHSPLVDGAYFLRLQTPTFSHTKPIQVTR